MQWPMAEKTNARISGLFPPAGSLTQMLAKTVAGYLSSSATVAKAGYFLIL